MATLSANLNLTPKDAVAFFAAKGEKLAWDYTDVFGEANVHAFTVAKVTELELLRTIRAEVGKAIGTGQSFESFKKALRPRLVELGWWGTKEVLDADTGEVDDVQLGNDRRLRTIYQTNVTVAYSAGRYKRYLDNAADRPYWRYVAIMDGRTRPAHRALHGKVWRFDDPIWAILWPPNGWGCRCRVDALTEAEFKKLGVPLEDGRDAIVETEMAVNKNGDQVLVRGVKYTDEKGNERVFWPDPGWDYNPGAAWAHFDPAGFKGEALGVAPITPAPAAGVVKSQDGLTTWADLGRPDLRAPDIPRLPVPAMLPQSPSREAAAEMITKVLLGDQRMRVVTTPVEEVVIRAELLPHIVEKVENGRERYANFVIPALEDPFEVWLTPYDDGSYRKRYIALFEGRSDMMIIVRENRDGSLFWELYNVMQSDTKRLNKAREGALLYAKDLPSE